MMIGRNNYEEYILDFLEGKLEPDIQKSMELFLLNNPEVAIELENVQDTVIPPAIINNIDKSSLYRNFTSITEINEINFEELCIAYHEGDLDISLKDRLIDFIKENAEREKIFSLYQSVRYFPDSKIRFTGKSSLKKYAVSVYRKFVIYGTSIAAAILLFIVLNQKLGDNIYTIATTVNNIDINKQPATHMIIPKEKANSFTELPMANIQSQETLAAIDTNQQHKSNFIRLASLNPIEAKAFENAKDRSDSIPLAVIHLYEEDTLHFNNSNLLLAEDQIRKPHKSSDNIIIKALKLGIKGISDLTESDIELHTQTDEKGNLTAFALSAGEFEFSRKLNSKLQKN